MKTGVTLTITDKDENGQPYASRTSRLSYESVSDARRQLRKRWPDTKFFDVPGGFGYEQTWSCKGESGIQVFTFTERGKEGNRRLTLQRDGGQQ